MTLLLANPELVRNVRAQLRPGRMLAVAGICAAVSLAIGYSMANAPPNGGLLSGGGMTFLRTILWLQIAALIIGGGIICLHAIQREKDQNTFDFQRLTRLSPLELTLGKLFGAPVLAYFVVLCLMPAAIVGAAIVRLPLSFVVAAYAILLLGGVAYHAFALLISLVISRSSAAAAVLLFLLVVAMTSFGEGGPGSVTIGTLSPFFILDLVQQTSWSAWGPRASPVADIVFGQPVHHFWVLLALYLTFTAWLLAAVVRNLKRDPSSYELYTSVQALGLACYLNLVFMAFIRWTPWRVSILGRDTMIAVPGPFHIQTTMLGFNVWLFALLGLALLRNRDRMRRRLRSIDEGTSGWLVMTWPAPYVALGTLLVGAAGIALIHWKRDPTQDWNLTVAGFRVVFLALWLVRDLAYLQWTNLRRGSRPLVMGVLYLGVFYVCLGLLVGSLNLAAKPFMAVFVPTPIFVTLDTKLWSIHPSGWVFTLVMQVVLGVFFMFLQRQAVAELAARPAAAPAD